VARSRDAETRSTLLKQRRLNNDELKWIARIGYLACVYLRGFFTTTRDGGYGDCDLNKSKRVKLAVGRSLNEEN